MNTSIVHQAGEEATTFTAFDTYLHKRGILAEGLHPELIEGKQAFQIGIDQLIKPFDGREAKKDKEWRASYGLKNVHRGFPLRPFEGALLYYQDCLDKVERFRIRWLGDDLRYQPDEADETACKTGSELVEAPRWEAAAGAKVVPYLCCLRPEWLRDTNKPILIVESPIKAIALAQYGFAVIGMGGAEAGLHASSNVEDKVLALHPEANRIRWEGRTAYLMMDSGQLRNPSVARGVARDGKLLMEVGADVRVVYLPERKPKRTEDQADPKSYDWGPDDAIAHVLWGTFDRLRDATYLTEHGEPWRELAAKIAVTRAKLALVNLLLESKPADPLERAHECESQSERDELLNDLPFVASLKFVEKHEWRQIAKALGSGKLGEIKDAVASYDKRVRDSITRKRVEDNNGPTFERGDHVEISQQLRSDLGPLTVHSEGSYWQYSDTDGCWRELRQERLYGIIEGYAGAPYGDSVLKIDAKDIKGSLTIAEMGLKDVDFFESEKPGFTFKNGFVVVDKEGVRVEAAHPDQRKRLRYDFDFSPEASCPRFEQFLKQILTPELPFPEADATDEDMEEFEQHIEAVERDVAQRRQYLLEHLGLSLIGEAPRLAGSVLILLGDGANGKSTLAEVIEELFPKGSVGGVAPHDWTNDQKVALLVGKLLNIVGELPSKELGESERFKAIVTGMDRVTFKNVYERPGEFKGKAGHLINANTLPPSGDGTYGFLRRNVVIPLTRVFSKERQDRNLKSKLLTEREGILRLLLEAAQVAVARGKICDPPETSVEALEAWAAKSDPVRTWSLGHLRLGWAVEALGSEPPMQQWKSAYSAYSDWADGDKRRGITSVTFEERVGTLLREMARHDRDVLSADPTPLISDLHLRRGYTHQADCTGDGCTCRVVQTEGRRAFSKVKGFLADGLLRSKVDGSSVRRVPFILATEANLADGIVEF